MQQGLLADYIVGKQLFAFWLPDMCRPGTAAQQLFWQLTRPAWQQQSVLSVMGYYPLQEVHRDQILILFLVHVCCFVLWALHRLFTHKQFAKMAQGITRFARRRCDSTKSSHPVMAGLFNIAHGLQ